MHPPAHANHGKGATPSADAPRPTVPDESFAQTESDRSSGQPGADHSDSLLLEASYLFSRLTNHADREDKVLREFVAAIKDVSGCEAVGIRIHHDGKWLSYMEHTGFSDDFLEEEKNLHLDRNQCFCTRVFLQQTDATLPFFTETGSFFTNRAETLPLDAATVPSPPVRCNCILAGYRSIGLFPIRSLNKVLGLIHVADPGPDRLPRGLVRLLENGALQLGVSIEKARASAALRVSFDELEAKVNRRTHELEATVESLKIENRQRLVAEKELKRSRHLLQLVFESISDPLVLLDEKAQVMMINQAAMDYYGTETADDAIHNVCFKGLGRFNEACQSCRIPAAISEGRAMEFERSGFVDRQRTEVVGLYPIRDDSGAPKGAVMQIHDITAARDTQKQVTNLRTQASLGMLVSSVAHEIKNPNSFIAFNISVLRSYFNDLLPVLDAHADADPDFEVAHLPYDEFREDVFKLMDTIEHGSKRIDLFLGNLKTLGPNRPKARCVRLRLVDVISRVMQTVRSKIEKTVRTFDVRIAPDLPDVYSDAGILEQVLINLLVNASQAADKGDAFIHLIAEPSQADARWVVLSVADNGHGMDEHTRRLIFEPFYSTKVAEGGTGLGLFVCRNLVQEIGGRLHLESQLGIGTRFTVDLPTHASMCQANDKDTNQTNPTDPPREESD